MNIIGRYGEGEYKLTENRIRKIIDGKRKSLN